MGKQTIAECIESLEILERMGELDVDIARGVAVGAPSLCDARRN